MNATESYVEAVRAYVDGVRVLLAPAGQEAGERGGRGPTSYADLEAQAEALAPLSARVTEEAVGRLEEPSPAERIEVETALLAKTFADLEVCAYLLEASEDQRTESPWEPEAGRGRERSAASRGAAEPALQLLLGDQAPPPGGAERGRKPTSVDEARVELTLQAGDALVLIAERAADSGRTGLEGLVSIGMDEITKAIGVVGLDIAKALGQAEQVTQLYRLFRDFLERACDSIMALLGPQVAEFVGKQVKGWVEKIMSGELVDDLLEKLYQTAKAQVPHPHPGRQAAAGQGGVGGRLPSPDRVCHPGGWRLRGCPRPGQAGSGARCAPRGRGEPGGARLRRDERGHPYLSRLRHLYR
jgi:hypothetical protein